MVDADKVKALLTEWRDARQAIFAAAYDDKRQPALWLRLARAETALMDYALLLGS